MSEYNMLVISLFFMVIFCCWSIRGADEQSINEKRNTSTMDMYNKE